MKLISATPSPYARKVRIALAEKGLPFELVTEVPWNEDTRTPLHNPLEKLPILLLDAFVLLFFERMRPAEHRSAPWMARQRRKVEGGVREIARSIGSRAWAVGDRFGLGDIAVGTAMAYLDVRFPDFEWRGTFPDLALYVDRLGERPSFRSTVPVPQKIAASVV